MSHGRSRSDRSPGRGSSAPPSDRSQRTNRPDGRRDGSQLTTRDRGDDLVLLRLGIEGTGVEDVLSFDLLGNGAASRPGLGDQLLGFGNRGAPLFGDDGRIPFNNLVAVTIGNDDPSHSGLPFHEQSLPASPSSIPRIAPGSSIHSSARCENRRFYGRIFAGKSLV